MVRNGCPFSSAPPASATTTYTNCSDQNGVSLKKILAMKPERVVISGMTPYGYGKALAWGWASNEAMVSGYTQMLQPLVAAGIRVSVIADTPYPEFSVPDCVSKNGIGAGECLTVQKVTEDPLVEAAEKIGNIQVINLDSYMCKDGSCPPIVGNVLVFRDNHLTTTFAKTLARPLEEALGLGL